MKIPVSLSLALAVAAYAGCRVGDTRWCTSVSDDSQTRQVDYGGPEAEIRKLLKDPCEGTRVGSFWSLAGAEKPEAPFMYFLNCPETRNFLEIYPAALEILHLRDDMTEDTLRIYGEQADKAVRRARSAAKEITKRAGTYNWKP